MTAPVTPTDRLRQPRIIRRIVYVLAGVIGLVAVIFGFATEQQVDAFTASAAFTSVVNFLAAAFTRKGADSSATDSELAAANAELADVGTASSVNLDLLDGLRSLIDGLPAKLLGAIRAEERGEHDQPSAQEDAPDSVTEYYRRK